MLPNFISFSIFTLLIEIIYCVLFVLCFYICMLNYKYMDTIKYAIIDDNELLHNELLVLMEEYYENKK
jgi:hypothetical protein